MLPYLKPQRGSHRSAIALLALLAPISAIAQEDSKDIEPLIVSALRVPRPASTVTSSVTVLDPLKLENQGILQLRDALNFSPGVISTSTSGQTGAAGSLFIRGTNTAYSQIVIDGMRLSDSSAPLGNLLASSRTYDVGNIEILRGTQSAIYGGESIGGVVWLETPRGNGAASGAITYEGGAFDSHAARAKFQGEVGDLSYYLSGGYEQTQNDGDLLRFRQGNTALRIEGKINPVWTLGTTYRSVDSFYENAGASDDRVDSALATVYAIGKISDRWTSRFHTGYQQEFYDSDSSYGNYGSDMRSGSISTDQEITLAENIRLLAGAFFHRSSFENTIGTDESRDRYGVHSALEWDIVENLTTTAALRWEDYDAYGDELTWRIGSIYMIEKTGTSFRGGIGTSFRSPSYLDLFGSSFGAGNPDLEAESALGWDLGIEQKIGDHHLVEATWFRNRIQDQILANPTPPVNVSGKSTTDGLEFGLRGQWLDRTLSYRLAWTYLHESLSDQPRNFTTAGLDWKPTDLSLVGIGVTHLSSHSWGGDPLASYTIARIHGSYQITENVRLHARIENAFDEEYELGSFYGTVSQGAGTGAYAGITFNW